MSLGKRTQTLSSEHSCAGVGYQQWCPKLRPLVIISGGVY